jgi:hypothetical protein
MGRRAAFQHPQPGRRLGDQRFEFGDATNQVRDQVSVEQVAGLSLARTTRSP